MGWVYRILATLFFIAAAVGLIVFIKDNVATFYPSSSNATSVNSVYTVIEYYSAYMTLTATPDPVNPQILTLYFKRKPRFPLSEKEITRECKRLDVNETIQPTTRACIQQLWDGEVQIRLYPIPNQQHQSSIVKQISVQSLQQSEVIQRVIMLPPAFQLHTVHVTCTP